MTPRRHIAGLDGLRGLALVVIMGYHLAPGAVPGGFVTLTLFFSLSGYLITTLMLDDLDEGRFTLRSFYSRRIRRLVPAGLLVIAGIGVLWWGAGWMDTDVRSQLGFAAGQVFNWQEVSAGQVYGTERLSPVMHYWSLAVEEQIYLLLPLLLLAGRRRPGVVLAAAFAVPLISTAIWAGNRSVVYYGTHVRAGEVLLGALAAVAVRRWGGLPRGAATAVSAVALSTVLYVAFTVEVGEENLYRGGLLVGGALTALVVATVPMGALARFVDNPPLARIGRLSYVIYLVHWPAMVAFERIGWNPWFVAAGTVATSLALAEIVHRWYEAPMRSSWAWPRFAAVLGCVVAVGGASVVGAGRPPVSFEDAAAELARRSGDLAPTGAVPTVAILGDSKMLTLGMGMATIDGFDFSYMHGILRCPLGRGGEVMIEGEPYPVGPECSWDTVSDRDTDIALLWFGTWDASGRRIPALGDAWRGLDDPEYRDWLATEHAEFFELLRSRLGTELIVAMTVHPDGSAELAAYNDFLREVVGDEPDVEILDFAAWVAEQDTASYLPDGVHLSWGTPTAYSPNTDNSARRLMRTWLAPQLCDVVAERLGAGRAGPACAEIVQAGVRNGP